MMCDVLRLPLLSLRRRGMSIGEMCDDSFMEFLVGRFKGAHRSVDAEFVWKIIRDLGGVPGDVRELCDALWSVTQNGERIDAANLDAAYRYIFAHEGGSYETYIWLLTIHQRKVLGALAAVGGAHASSNDFLDAAGCHNASSVKKALVRLADAGHVYHFKGEWKFASPFFREWMRRKV